LADGLGALQAIMVVTEDAEVFLHGVGISPILCPECMSRVWSWFEPDALEHRCSSLTQIPEISTVYVRNLSACRQRFQGVASSSAVVLWAWNGQDFKPVRPLPHYKSLRSAAT